MHLLVHRVLFVVLLTSTLVLNFCVPPFLDKSNVNTGQAEEESQIIIVDSNKQRNTLIEIAFVAFFFSSYVTVLWTRCLKLSKDVCGIPLE